MNKSLGEILRGIRERNGLLLREVAASLEMDTALLSKIERNERIPSKEQVMALAKFYQANPNELLVALLSDRIALELEDEEMALKAVQIAEQKIRISKRKRAHRHKKVA